MIYRARKGQASYGEAIGILLLDTYTPFIPGDVGNGTTYGFPVRFQKVPSFTVERAIQKDHTAFASLLAAAKQLQSQGVRAITGDCGYMVIHQQELKKHVDVPVFLSSLLQIPFISSIIGDDKKIAIMCADSRQLNLEVIQQFVGIHNGNSLVIGGMQERRNFNEAILEEVGLLDAGKIEQEMVSEARQMVAADSDIGAFLLECSCLPPYGAAIQEAVDLPVFDYITMINYVYTAVVKQRFQGFM